MYSGGWEWIVRNIKKVELRKGNVMKIKGWLCFKESVMSNIKYYSEFR